jgi:succinylarginine dihydrolase
VIASRFGPYRQYQAEAPEPVCVLADGDREWQNALTRLAFSKADRRELARANAQYVDRAHRISLKVVHWRAALATVSPLAAV